MQADGSPARRRRRADSAASASQPPRKRPRRSSQSDVDYDAPLSEDGNDVSDNSGDDARRRSRRHAVDTHAYHAPRNEDGFVHLASEGEEAEWRRAQHDKAVRRAEEAEAVVETYQRQIAAFHKRRADKRERRRKRKQEKRNEAQERRRAAGGVHAADEEVDEEADDDSMSSSEDLVAPALTKGTTGLRATVGAVVTEDDVEAQMENDDNSLVWYDVPPPDEVRAQRALGPLSRNARAYCFACESGGPSVSAPQVANMARMWREGRGFMRKEDLAKQLHEYFVTTVCARANRVAASMGTDRPMLQDWTPACIAEHFTTHVDDPDTFLVETIHQLGVVQRRLYMEGLFQQNSRPPFDTRMSEKRLRMYLSAVRQRESLYGKNSTRMAMYNGDKVAVSAAGRPAFNPRRTTGGLGPSSAGSRIMSSMFGARRAADADV